MNINTNFLLVPSLYEASSATVSWENVHDSDRYELDIVFNDSFDRAGIGKTWSDAKIADWTWSDQNMDTGLTWQQMDALPAQGLMWRNLEFMNQSWDALDADRSVTWKWIQEHPVCFTTYSGAGEDIPAPDQGLAWSNIDSKTWSWADQHAEDSRTWKDISLLPSVGLYWHQHDQNSFTWTEIESKYTDWRDFEIQPPRGLCWGSLEGKWLSWEKSGHAEETDDGLSWWDIEHLPPDNQTHKGTVVKTPLYTKSSMLRVRTINKNHLPSTYLTTGQIKHNPRSLASYRPPCIHIPKLYEGKPAEIIWGNLYGASQYILERKCDNGYDLYHNTQGNPIAHSPECNESNAHYYGPDCKMHLACIDQIPYGQKTAQYRIRGYNTTDHSQCLESEVVTIIPVFYRDDQTNFTIEEGKLYAVQLNALAIHAFDSIIMKLKYDPTVLCLDQIIADTDIQDVCIQDNGALSFRCTKSIRSGSEWSGLVMIVQFKASYSGITGITLS